MTAKSFALAVPGVVLLYLTILAIGIPVRHWHSKSEPHEIMHFKNNRVTFEEMAQKFKGQDKIKRLFINSAGELIELNACKKPDTFEKIFVRLGKLKEDFPKGLPKKDEMMCKNGSEGLAKFDIVNVDKVYERYGLEKADVRWYIDELKKIKYRGIGRSIGRHSDGNIHTETILYLTERRQICHDPSPFYSYSMMKAREQKRSEQNKKNALRRNIFQGIDDYWYFFADTDD